MSKILVGAGNNTCLPDQTPIEVFASADGGLGAYSAVVDPNNPTHALLPQADGSLPISAGASTSAKQDTGNAALASIDTKTPALVGGASPVTGPLTDTQLRATPVPISDGGGSVTIDGSVSVSGLVPGSGANQLGKAEDAPAADGDIGVMMLAVRKDTPATTVGADGDYHPLEVDANGRLHVTDSALGAPTDGAAGADTTNTGLTGLFKRLLQRITTLLAVFPTTIDTNSGARSASTLRVVIATDQPALTTPLPVSSAAAASELHIGEMGSALLNPSATVTRPADTVPYASGDLVANTVTAGSVTPFSWAAARVAAGSFSIRRLRLKKSTTSVANASFRMHLYAASPTCTNGDNGAWLTTESTYLGTISLDMSGFAGRVFSDGAEVVGTPDIGAELNVKLASGQTIYGLLEARAAYGPGNAEVFTAVLEVLAN